MAGRGTDIMLRGNAEYMAKTELRKQGLSDELIAESNSFSETEDPEILAARAAYTEAYKRFKMCIRDRRSGLRVNFAQTRQHGLSAVFAQLRFKRFAPAGLRDGRK